MKCTDSQSFNSELVKIEQTLSLRGSIEQASVLLHQGQKKEVVKEIIRVIEFFLKATGKELEEFQIMILAGDLYDLFKTDEMEDVIMMFKMARKGEFGKLYKFDTMTITHWAHSYLERKSQERENLYQEQKHGAILSPESHYFPTPERLEELRKIKEKADLAYHQNKVKKALQLPPIHGIEGFVDRLKNRYKYKNYDENRRQKD